MVNEKAQLFWHQLEGAFGLIKNDQEPSGLLSFHLISVWLKTFTRIDFFAANTDEYRAIFCKVLSISGSLVARLSWRVFKERER